MPGAPRSAPPAPSRLPGSPLRETFSRSGFWKSPGRAAPARVPAPRTHHRLPAPRGSRPPPSSNLAATAGAPSIAGGCARSATGGGRALRPGRAARAAAPSSEGGRGCGSPAREPARPSVRPSGRVPHRHASRPGAAPRGRARGQPPPGNPPGSVGDWPALSGGFACQWHRGRPGAWKTRSARSRFPEVLVVVKRPGDPRAHPLSLSVRTRRCLCTRHTQVATSRSPRSLSRGHPVSN